MRTVARSAAKIAAIASIALFAFACRDASTSPDELDGPSFRKASQSSDVVAMLTQMAEAANAQLEADGISARVDRAFYYTASQEAGQTVFFNNRAKQLPLHFVPGDPRRFVGSNTDIAYMVDQFPLEASNLPILVTTAAIDRAMATWNGANCSNIPITQLPNPPFNIGFVGGGFPAWLIGSDITHSGWLALGPNILGVAFGFIFVDLSGPTDIDNNGKLDTALWEIYYNRGFLWGINTNFPIDVETVALHEAGHGLDQGHFGKLFRTDANGKFHFAPRAVMNAGYTGVQQSPAGTDNGGHCSIWGSWPQN